MSCFQGLQRCERELGLGSGNLAGLEVLRFKAGKCATSRYTESGVLIQNEGD